MDQSALNIARQIAEQIRDKDRDKVELTELTLDVDPADVAAKLRGGGDAKSWLFSERDIQMQGRTLAIREYPWGTTEARLLTTPTEAEVGVSEGIAALRAIRF